MENLLILTDEQLITMAQEGSETAEEILIEKYKSFAIANAQPYFIAGADNDDLVQEGMIGLFKAIRSFDMTKDAKFKTFAGTCINNQILNAIKKANSRRNQVLNESVSMSNSAEQDESLTLGDILVAPSDDEPEKSVVLSEMLEHLNKDSEGVFSPLERQVLILKMQGHSYQEIAKLLGKTPKSIDNALTRIKEKVTKILED